MNNIRPISDLRNKFTEISKTVHETGEPIFLTKNGYGDMVVMSMEAYKNMQVDIEINTKLREAERELKSDSKKYSLEELDDKFSEYL